MRRQGFTLAEVLVTLGIIGVVAALTTPALIQNVGNAKIGPRLQKAKATFETAAEMMLNDTESNSISGFLMSNLDGTTVGGYNVDKQRELLGNTLANHMKINKVSDDDYKTINKYDGTGNIISTNYIRYDNDEGLTYWIKLNDVQKTDNRSVLSGFPDTPNNQLIGDIYVDINGPQKPNKQSKDTFHFWLYNDGTMRPVGAVDANRHEESPTWKSKNCDADGVNAPDTCTGSIFENGMKIIYE